MVWDISPATTFIVPLRPKGVIVPDQVEDDAKDPVEELDLTPPADATNLDPPTEPETPPEPVEPTGPTFLDTLRDDLGFEGIDDEDAGRTRLLEAYRQSRETEAQTNQRIRQLEEDAAYQRARARETPPTAPTTPEVQKETSAWPTVEQMSPGTVAEVQKYYDRETDQWRPGTPAHVREAAETYLEQQQQWQGYISDPTQLAGLVEAKIQEGVNRVLQDSWGFDPKELPGRLDINGDRAYIQQVLDTGEQVFFEKNPVTDQLDYNRLTATGQEFRRIKDHFQQRGYSERDAYESAYLAVQSQINAAQGQSAATNAREAFDQDKKDHLRRSSKPVQQRSGSTPRTPEEQATLQQNPNESPALAVLEQEGFFDSRV